jgi:hypothetical protein
MGLIVALAMAILAAGAGTLRREKIGMNTGTKK